MNPSIAIVSLLGALSDIWTSGGPSEPGVPPAASDSLPPCAPAVELPATWAVRASARTHLRVTLPADYQAAPSAIPGADAWAGADSSMLALFNAPRGSLQLPNPRPENTSECRGVLAGRPARVVIVSRPIPGGPKDTMYVWAAERIDSSATPLSALVFARSRAARDLLSAAASHAEGPQP